MSDAAKALEPVFEPWKDPSQKPLIRFENVTKRFGDFTAIDDLTINIYEKEFFALLGPSGCGKTTMMRMLGGFETPTEGSITIDGQDMSAVPPNKRAVNMMFQSYALFPHLSVADNIAFGLKRDKLPADQIAARVEEMLSLVQLNKFASRKPHQISGGQRQRVALARSLAKAPKLLLLDEPLGALDKKLRQDTQFELMDIQETTGTTFVIVTHDQEEAMTVASRIAVMDHGKIVQVDTPAKIYEEPGNIYVADFIGDVNLIKGKVVKSGNDHASISWAEGQQDLTGIAHDEIPHGTEATLAIRPEKVTISTDRPEGVTNALSGTVLDIAYLGNMSTYVIEAANGTLIKAQAANTRRISRRAITWEQQVWLSFTDTAGVVLTS
ncbi:ABC transporter ATP-binding protein [Aliiroseovarius lamellibrachiae]|uniref:ABC transporter ATP-binding protein n=1 Tax=Aliiroseovarius lamellibrachiae TaxID=1924933 RepID=UPI001BDFBEFD|nr:ABC transporter ATP-binding protein [Aliiroseovarius lamellibrachiae]MBT2129998.1 ABC transporter ATP-binding protein [Aliiroseovarius lamellibrachiae]